MTQFAIVPLDDRLPSTKIVSNDEAAPIYELQRMGSCAADIWRNGRYAYSLRLGSNGLCQIYRREEAAYAVASAFG